MTQTETLYIPTWTETTRLKVNMDNPRTITDDNFEALKQSLREFPKMLALRPIIIDQDGIILGGNMRYQAAVQIGMEYVPIIDASDLTPEEVDQLIIKDNIPYGEWNATLLDAQWPAEKLMALGIPKDKIIGWHQVIQEEDLETNEDDFILDENLETDIQPGDCFQIGAHRLYCGDSTTLPPYNALFLGQRANLVLTDPPYNVDYDDGTGRKIEGDKQGDKAFYDFLLKAFTRAVEHTEPGGGIYIFHADSEGRNFRNSFVDAGWLAKQCLIWNKNSFTIGRQDYQWKHEPILYGWKPGAAHYFIHHRDKGTVIDQLPKDLDKLKKDQLLKIITDLKKSYQASVLDYDKPKRNDLHPTMKPITLLGQLIQNSSKQGDIILDSFAGSGSTMVAAHQLKRKCYAIEYDPKYCQAIIDRMTELEPNIHIKKL